MSTSKLPTIKMSTSKLKTSKCRHFPTLRTYLNQT
jgi:hypothetical protein